MTGERHIRVRVKAGTRKERIEQVGEGVYTIEVREKAERGEANARVRELLSGLLHVRPEDLRLIKGATSPAKLFLVTNHESL